MSDELLPRVCGRTDCGKPATHIAGLILRASRHTGGMQVVLDLLLCSQHARYLTPKQVITDEGWAKICAGMEELDKAPPVRSLTEAFATPIDEAPEVFRARYQP